jgi:glutamate-ammonia-ligase adenylyltransferase
LRNAHAVLLDAGLRCTLDRRARLVPEDAAIAAARAAIVDAWRTAGLA